ncbi:ester cyclase [Rhodobacteraceae bacterium N5(2021)]|uniref:Ester cyclase n=1 Tax=Gymnodinialimonas phycosphaerae TaxID=2841589 RepID=A0A975YHG6_9RHOB|nr:ester cyclase [Gymnodinialimonas phycosphaerae]MBY4892788.1 ester cyclase [Gymnodinialimonas phycosphaerae]
MQGFDPQFEDLTDYILKCTAMIWEGRDIAALNWHYGDDLLVRTPAGISRGNEAGKANTMATLVEFPDRQLLGEDVIWSGDEKAGFLSSHRIVSTATHRGGAFGPATGAKLTFRTIADTFCRENRVWDEWLIRDNAAIAVGLGHSAQDAARAQILAGQTEMPLTPATDIEGPYTGRGNNEEWGRRHGALLRRIMDADFAAIPKTYDRACHLSLPGGQDVHGWEATDAFWIGLRSAFPSATFQIDHQIGRHDPLLPPRSAIRWSLTGTHDGWGRFGPPTGTHVHVMAVSHVEFGPRGIRRETTLFDEIAIWKQILLQTGAAA